MSLSSSAVRMMLRPIRPKPLMPTLMGILPPMDFVKRRRAFRCKTGAKPNPKCYGLRNKKSTRSERGTIPVERCDSQGESEMLLRVLLDVGHAIAIETHKNRLRRWLAINPILDIVAFVVAFADFVIGLA